MVHLKSKIKHFSKCIVLTEIFGFEQKNVGVHQQFFQ